jgi:hypothetical protein
MDKARAAKYAAVGVAALIAGAAGLAGSSLVSDNGQSSNPRVTIFCGEFKPLIEASNVYAKWASQNQGERDKWLVYSSTICLDQQPTYPDMATSFGKALVSSGRMALTIDVPPETTTTSTTQTTTTTQPPTTTTTTTTPAETGALRDSFTDFYTGWGISSTDHNGQIFQNRWNQPNLQTLFTTQTPWSSTGGAAIYQVTDSSGRPGFRFLCNPGMLSDSSSKKTEIYEGGPASPYGTKMVRGLGFTDEISFDVDFPSSGNANGFPGPSEGVYDRRNVFWQHSMDGSNNLDFFGISRLGGTNRFYLSVMRNSSAGTELAGFTLPWEVQLDTDYRFHYIIKWAGDSTGTLQWWVKRPSDTTEVQYADYHGPTWGSAPNTEFGFYTKNVFNNEDVISDIRVTQH